MLSKAQNKYISALRTKKYRTEHSQFIVEGKKCLIELLQSDFYVERLYYTEAHTNFVESQASCETQLLSEATFQKISAQKNPEGLLAIVGIPHKTDFELLNKRYIALDKIRDPGNMGTIIRLADWFGIHEIICSADCVDIYNTKTVQASMGSLFHVDVHYLNLAKTLSSAQIPCLAATLHGTSVYDYEPIDAGVLVIGNEANGISDEILVACSKKITIPNKGNAESLNAAMACGILCSHLFS